MSRGLPAVSTMVATVLLMLATPPLSAATLTPFSTAPAESPPTPWKLVTLPKLPKPSSYRVVALDGARVLEMRSDGGYANLLHPLPPGTRGTRLAWRWRADRHPAGADLTKKSADDMPARVCVLFDLPLERLTAGERFKVRLGRALFDPDLPAAAICYVWDATLRAGTWLPNAYTARVQLLVLRSTASGDADGAWVSESRDLAADFARAFPYEARAGLPPLAAIGVATDGDNTGGSTLAYLGDLVLESAR